MRQKCDKIIAHGCNVFINRQLIYNLPESIFTENGVMAIEHADFDGIERLAAVTGGEVVSTFDRPDLVTMGQCDVIEEVRRIYASLRHQYHLCYIPHCKFMFSIGHDW